jgi:two-component system response regulator AtoC
MNDPGKNTHMKSILIVDDELATRESLRMILKRKYDLLLAASGEEALNTLQTKQPDLILLDIIMPGMDGMETLKQIKEKNRKQQVVMITATKTVKTAVDAMKLGAFDYLTKPFDVNEITSVVAEAVKEEGDRRFKIICDKSNIVGKSAAMQKIYEMIRQVADRKTTVLLSGESGTGKELVARAIHFNGPRRDKPFVALNCAAIPETLIESELFGHEKGAFTNAYERRIGHFELSQQGTLFLDEITELSLYTQAKILRFLQEKEFTRVGGTKPITVDTRLIAATNQNLEEALKDKQIREDFYYRINVVPIVLPPLRERRDDIPLLIDYFLKKIVDEEGHQPIAVSDDAMKVFEKYDWPGNVREMENLLTLACVLGKEEVILEETVKEILQRSQRLPHDRPAVASLDEAEVEILKRALSSTQGNLTQAARLLKISRPTLRAKIQKYHL